MLESDDGTGPEEKKFMQVDATDKLRSVRDDVIQCTQCDLYKTRKNPVIGYGNHNADIMFVGEAPGEEEDKQALPFVGAAGHVLDKLLKDIDLKREDIYICNTVKCRPPMNADPTDEQKNECLSYLTRQIEAIKPKVIVCLGNHAIKTVMSLLGLEDKVDKISVIHGMVFDSDPAIMDVKVMPLYHPAAMLHNPPLATTLRHDFKKLQTVVTGQQQLL